MLLSLAAEVRGPGLVGTVGGEGGEEGKRGGGKEGRRERGEEGEGEEEGEEEGGKGGGRDTTLYLTIDVVSLCVSVVVVDVPLVLCWHNISSHIS